MFSLERRRLKGDLIVVYSFLKREGGRAGAKPFSLAINDRLQGNGRKICQGRFRLGVRKRFYIQRMVEQWNEFPRDVVMAPRLTVFKKRLDNTLRHIM